MDRFLELLGDYLGIQNEKAAMLMTDKRKGVIKGLVKHRANMRQSDIYVLIC